MLRRVVLYFMTLTIPLFLGLVAWQATRYTDLEKKIEVLVTEQEEWIENNKRLIAGIAVLSSVERIEHIARNQLALTKKRPEDVLQVQVRRERSQNG
ncbi:MAG: septum formation initiator family protein [Spirochaetaceae bacterium]|jgi:cell division protein FtsL|nr:septum formation initiator family protein [Spirochaetaceae bacterium]